LSEQYEYSETDMDALRRAMEIAMRDPSRKEQLESKVNSYRGVEPEPWTEVAEFAAFCVQSDTLHLKPWECPPCSAYDDKAAMKLLDRILEAGLSQWEPDPLGALAAKG